MILHRHLLLLTLLTGYVALPAMAQQQYFSYSMKRLSQDDGLSQGSNYFRYEDSKGFMWITGNDALNRFDGSVIKVYNLNRYFKGCPPLQQGYGFAEDNESNVYIGSVNGLYIYHRKTDKFILQQIYNGKERLAIPFAFKDRKVWCFNRKYEIMTYDVATGKINPVVRFPIEAVNSVHVYDMQGPEGFSFYYRFPFFDNNNNLWAFGTQEVYKFNKNTKALQQATLHTLKQHHLLVLCAYFYLPRNELLIGTSKGLLRYHVPTGREQLVQRIGGRDLGEVNSIACKDDVIALRSVSGSLLTDWTFRNNYWGNYPSTTLTRRVYGLGFDKAGRLWMCDDGLGQAICSFSQPLLSKIPGTNNDFAKLQEKGVGGFAEMPNGDIFFQNDYLLEHGTRSLKAMRRSGADLGFPNGFRMETDPGRKGVWLYGLNEGRKRHLKLYFMNSEQIPLRKYAIAVPDSLGACNMLQVLKDGRILVSFSNGLFWLKDQLLVPVKNIPYKSFFTISPLSGNRYAISYLNKDMLLVALDSTDGMQVIRSLLPGIQSFYMQEDTARHQYWAGTNKGVYLLDRSFRVLKHFDANNGLSGTYIYGLLLDQEGNAWCSHQHGLSSITTPAFRITNYDKNDGIQDWDFNNRAFYKSTDGTLYFGGVGGFNYFKPPLKPVSYYDPEVYVDEISVNNHIFLPDSNANEIRDMHLPHYRNNITIRAMVKDLDNTAALIYRLRESDAQWKYMAGRNTLSFNSLAPGHYQLELGVFDKYRHQYLHQKTIGIFIEAPFYLKPWFWAFVAIGATAAIAWRYHSSRLTKQRTAFRQQLALEKQRSKITADLHDDIGASLSSLQVNSMVAHELLHQQPDRAQKVLEKIASQSKTLSESIGDIIWSMKPGKDEFMTMSSRIRNFANDILSDTDIAYQINIDEKINTLISDITIRKNIVFITKEAINNVVKYSRATKLLVSLQADRHQVTLGIEDDGIGFRPEQQPGNGICNMKRRTEEMDGIWTLETAPGKGTVINISIPLPVQE